MFCNMCGEKFSIINNQTTEAVKFCPYCGERIDKRQDLSFHMSRCVICGDPIEKGWICDACANDMPAYPYEE